MFYRTKRPPIIHSRTINKRKRESLNRQLEKVPELWKNRFIKDQWQLVVTDKMPEEYGGAFIQYYAIGNDKQIWLNVSIPTLLDNIILKAIACYVYMEYANINNSYIFSQIVKESKKEIQLFMAFRGVLQYDELQIFVEMFSFVIETNGKYTNQKLSSLYYYLKKWVNGEVFNENYYQLPDYIEIGRDVINEQIENVKDAFLMLPIRLQRRFINDRWKIRISHEQIGGKSTYGLCSSIEGKIFIRSSTPNIRKTIWHEFGHYLDYKEFLISRRKTFRNLYQFEKERLKKFYKSEQDFTYAISSEEEYFAEIFAAYIDDSDLISKFVPKSVQFIREIIQKWS